MNAKNLPLFSALLVFSVSFCLSQEEDFAEFENDLRQHFLNIGEEVSEELDSMNEDESNLLAELEEAQAAGEGREAASLEIELARLRAGLNAWKALSTKYQEIMTLKGEAFVEQEGFFHRALDGAHRKRDIAESKARASHLEMELRFLREEEPDDAEEAALIRELKQAKAEWKNRVALHEGWQKVEAAINEGRHEEADQMERKLWVKGQDLAFQIESTEIRHRVVEARERTDDLRKEAALAQGEAKMAADLLKQRQELRKVWQKTKDALANSNGEDFEELLDEYHQVETKYQVKREMMEARLHLARAKAHGDEEQIDEFQRILEELEEEAIELE